MNSVLQGVVIKINEVKPQLRIYLILYHHTPHARHAICKELNCLFCNSYFLSPELRLTTYGVTVGVEADKGTSYLPTQTTELSTTFIEKLNE